MNGIFKAGLLAGVSVAALSLSVATPSYAFDSVDWTWDATVTENVVKNVNVNININPTGMTMIEGLQGHIGDVMATSVIEGTTNTQPASAGTVDLGTVDFQFHYGLGGTGVVVLDDSFKSPNVVTGTVDEGDEAPNINGTVVGSLSLGTVEVPASAVLSAATDLPSVVSAATAVANNLTIGSDVATELHIGQFAIGDGSGEIGAIPNFGTNNSNLTVAGALASMAVNGSLVKAKVEAKSTVSEILNASVDSSATAVANNLTVAVAPATAGDGLLIGDVIQFAYADVKANSKVTGVTLSNYSGLGSLTRPVVSSVATAVGNNASITVKTPVVAVP
ncbi:hypothetical protein V6B08_17615 [Ferrovibrio sp. MS7]|uniref:hypothetical protein n=1 Tax=Ferrovibrio plantarum TaxID=3119164 RepID=UPI003134827F